MNSLSECKFEVSMFRPSRFLGWTRCQPSHVGLEAQWSELNTVYLPTHPKYTCIFSEHRNCNCYYKLIKYKVHLFILYFKLRRVEPFNIDMFLQKNIAPASWFLWLIGCNQLIIFLGASRRIHQLTSGSRFAYHKFMQNPKICDNPYPGETIFYCTFRVIFAKKQNIYEVLTLYRSYY